MRLVACVTTCLVPMLAAAAQMAPQLRPTDKRIVLTAVRTFIPIRVSPAKAAINSDRAIAGKQTGALLPCQERSASHRTARSNYPLKIPLFPRPPRLAADARPQPTARNVHFGGKGRRKIRSSALHQIADIGASRVSCIFLEPTGSRAYGLHKV
jgi:hypothetical protein